MSQNTLFQVDFLLLPYRQLFWGYGKIQINLIIWKSCIWYTWDIKYHETFWKRYQSAHWIYESIGGLQFNEQAIVKKKIIVWHMTMIPLLAQEDTRCFKGRRRCDKGILRCDKGRSRLGVWSLLRGLLYNLRWRTNNCLSYENTPPRGQGRNES